MSQREIAEAIRLRAEVPKAQRRADAAVYRALRIKGVPAAELAARLGVTRQCIYQMAKRGLTSST